MSSTVTSGAVIESLDAASLSKHAVIVYDHPNDTSTAIDGHDANHSLGDSSKDGPTPGYRPPLTQLDTDFCAAVLFCKQFLEMERTQGSRSQESKPLLSRISGTLPSFDFYSVSDSYW